MLQSIRALRVTIELRPYQADLIEQIRGHMRAGTRNVLCQLPTGGGKTALTASMFHSASTKGFRCAFGVHRAELIRQAAATFDRVGIRYGVVSPYHPMELHHPVQILSIPTWLRRMDRVPAFNFIAWDECHHAAAKTWAKLHAQYPDAYHVGLTATPQRLDGSGLRHLFSELVRGPSVRWLIENAHLCRYRYFRPTIPTEDEDGKARLVGDAVRGYTKHAYGRSAIYFCKNVEHSRQTADAFNAAGIPAMHVDAGTPAAERLLAMERFERGELLVLTNVDLFGEGVDVPGVSCVGLLRRTESVSLYLQWCGRGLRTAPGKQDCIILDHGGNWQLHGYPIDDREWTLDGCMATQRDGSVSPGKRCPGCFAMNPAGAAKCLDCGQPFPRDTRAVKQVDGELAEVEETEAAAAQAQARREQGMTASLQGLIELGRMRGYRDPTAWAHAVWNARKGRKKA